MKVVTRADSGARLSLQNATLFAAMSPVQRAWRLKPTTAALAGAERCDHFPLLPICDDIDEKAKGHHRRLLSLALE